MATTIRDLLVTLGVKADGKQLMSFDQNLKAVKSSAFSLGLVLAGLGYGIKKIAEAGAKSEKTRVSFETMLGSVAKADKMIKDMRALSLETPFSFEEAESTIKMMIAMGSSFENVIAETRTLGDVAAGLGVPMDRLAMNFGQVRNMGYLSGRELRDFAKAGVPILEMLSEMTGRTKEQVQDMISARGISFQMVSEAFAKMSGAGGKFEGLMEKMSKTTGGLASNIGVLFSLAMRDIGSDANKNIIKDVLKSFYDWGKVNGNLKTTLYALAEAVFLIGSAFATWKFGTLIVNLGKLAVSIALMGKAGLLANLKLLLIGASIIFLTLVAIELMNVLFTDKHTVFHTMYEDLQNIMNYWKSEIAGSDWYMWLTNTGKFAKPPKTAIEKEQDTAIDRRTKTPSNSFWEFLTADPKTLQTKASEFYARNKMLDYTPDPKTTFGAGVADRVTKENGQSKSKVPDNYYVYINDERQDDASVVIQAAE